MYDEINSDVNDSLSSYLAVTVRVIVEVWWPHPCQTSLVCEKSHCLKISVATSCFKFNTT
ncbi:hypothetical protein [Spiroplasma sp. AdecLV25b]|uniref:hypothetical protein n=1 Tax=Spiroplasma sp. AdecLV25b TaxID=3027162 RepID=UPI0027DFFA10|nr:hypothetical protein [Spiroplasma sp. AdecLV25b]